MTFACLNRPLACALAFALSFAAGPAAALDSAFGCSGLEDDRDLPVMEGHKGMFFRIKQDIAMQTRFSDTAVEELAQLSEALAARGTTLVLAMVPTKAVTMPDLLPEQARILGFHFEAAVEVQRDVNNRLQQAGVMAVDLQTALFHTGTDPFPFFETDTHWNAYGSQKAARAIARAMAQDPRYPQMPKTRYETLDKGEVSSFSGMRRIIQRNCQLKVPEAITTQYETVPYQGAPAASPSAGDGILDIQIAAPAEAPLDIGLGDLGLAPEQNDAPLDIGLDAPLDLGLEEAPLDIGLETEPMDIGLDSAPLDIGLDDGALDIGLDDGGALDIGLGDAVSATPQPLGPAAKYEPGNLQVAVVGTSFADLAAANFPGFLAQYSSLEVVNYAITGGGKYSAVTSFLTSEDFQSAPPAFLVWESPIYLNPALNGDQPMRELIAAASGTCTTPLTLTPSEDGTGMTAVLPREAGPGTTLYLDSARNGVREVSFRFTAEDGRTRTKSIQRGSRMRLNGQFYMPLTGLWSDGAHSVTVSTPAGFGASPRLFTCSQMSS